MTTKSIPIKDICIDGKTQQRPVDDKVVARYAAMKKDGSTFPPVDIITDGKSNFLIDGFHRYFASIKLGKKYLEANITNGTQRDAIHASFSANKYNAVPRPDGTVKNILLVIWNDDKWNKVSVTDTAKHVGCTRAYVTARFAEFDKEAAGEVKKTKKKKPSASLFKPSTVDVRRGESKYEMKKPEKKVLDATGKQVPEHLVEFFERANEFRQPIKQLNDMLKTIRKGKEAGDLIYKFIKIENLTAEIGNVKRILRFALPYAVCPYCGGDEKNAECRACDGCGFVNEMTYKSTPKELK